MATPKNLFIPMKLDAFAFNEDVCNGSETEAKIAPIAQPNYTSLRISNYLVENDVLQPVDLHNTAPASLNSRITDLGTGRTHEERIGVYLHWILPRPFRGGSAATSSVKNPTTALFAKGIKNPNDDTEPKPSDQPVDAAAAQFPPAPNRWLVIRRLNTKLPVLPQGAQVDSVKAWMIESDRIRKIDDLSQNDNPDQTFAVDLQVDVSPFVVSSLKKIEDAPNLKLEDQAGIFIGICQDASNWCELGDNEMRAGLTVTSSSNQLFPDNQYHCSNVFSMRDTFEYQEDGKTKYLEAATADYYVIGWNATPTDDLFTVDPNSGQAMARKDRMRSFNMTFFDTQPFSDAIQHWADSSDNTRSLCHGAVYDVQWNRLKRPENIPANTASSTLNEKMPLAIGTTAVDSLLAYIKEHDHPEHSLAVDILRLQALLRAQDDSVGGHIAAADELQSYNFAHFDGGARFHFAIEDGKVPTPPSDLEREHLRTLNSVQHLCNTIQRRTKQRRWDLFSVWWKYISDYANANGSRDGEYSAEVDRIVADLDALDLAATSWSKFVTDNKADWFGVEPKAGVQEDFHQQKDPTLLIAGVNPGWPRDYQDALKVRLDTQTVGDKASKIDNAYCLENCIPPELLDSAKLLVAEFLALAQWDAGNPPKDCFFPLYHDGERTSVKPGGDNPWRDRWNNQQPWFPLYIEWEAEYVHIPIEHWQLMKLPGQKPSGENKIGLALNKDITQMNLSKKDVRRVSGRSLILPQPSFSLKSQLNVLFSSVSKDRLDALLPEEDRKTLYDSLDTLAFLSAPLDGLTDHLATCINGSHVKPLVRVPGRKPVPLAQAAEASGKIKLREERLALIDAESDPMPYGPNVSLLNNSYNAFKPVTHGQLHFLKINVIDKFGQAIHAIDPRYARKTPAVHPSTGDFHRPNPISDTDNRPNVVDLSRSEQPGFCEYIQLPPYINQPARLNAEFVVQNPDLKGSYWIPANEWDKPIWGWVVVNYVDRGIQVFLPDGTFYREARLTEGKQSDTKWLPFKSPPTLEPSTQLENLVNKLLEPDQKFFAAFMDMISRALESMSPPTGAYAQFISSLIGRPLALVNMGWSLELAAKPKSTQSTLEAQRHQTPDPSLLPGDAPHYYQWSLKLGDASMLADGLVGYFEDSGRRSKGNELDLEHVFTYNRGLDQKPLESPLVLVDNNYPIFKSFWLDPNDPNGKYLQDPEKGSVAFEKKRFEQMKIFGAMVDPFLPIKGFSSMLPVRSLQLPTWTWESALKKITAFFHAGPIVITEDVPKFDSDYELDGIEYLKKTVPGSAIALPSLPAADWAWLQSYKEGFMPLAVGPSSTRPTFTPGPYIATEGYLQMKTPISHDEAPYKPSST